MILGQEAPLRVSYQTIFLRRVSGFRIVQLACKVTWTWTCLDVGRLYGWRDVERRCVSVAAGWCPHRCVILHYVFLHFLAIFACTVAFLCIRHDLADQPARCFATRVFFDFFTCVFDIVSSTTFTTWKKGKRKKTQHFCAALLTSLFGVRLNCFIMQVLPAASTRANASATKQTHCKIIQPMHPAANTVLETKNKKRHIRKWSDHGVQQCNQRVGKHLGEAWKKWKPKPRKIVLSKHQQTIIWETSEERGKQSQWK